MELHTDNFFKQGDKAVRLYNEVYYKPAKAMLDELKSKDLLKDNPWIDEFQITFYYLWHHQGRRARQGAMMGAPDYAHWHGFFELQQDLYKLEEIYKKRIGNDRISPPALQNQRPISPLIRMMGLWKGDEVYRLNKKDFSHVNSNRICPFFQGIIHWS